MTFYRAFFFYFFMIWLFAATSGPRVASSHSMLFCCNGDEGKRTGPRPGPLSERSERPLSAPAGCSPGTLVSSHVPNVHGRCVGEPEGVGGLAMEGRPAWGGGPTFLPELPGEAPSWNMRVGKSWSYLYFSSIFLRCTYRSPLFQCSRLEVFGSLFESLATSL